MRLGTQVSRKWSFRGAYQAFLLPPFSPSPPSLSFSLSLARSLSLFRPLALVTCNIRACLAASEASPSIPHRSCFPPRPLDRRRSERPSLSLSVFFPFLSFPLSLELGPIPRGLPSSTRCLAHVPHTFLIDSTRFPFRRTSQLNSDFDSTELPHFHLDNPFVLFFKRRLLLLRFVPEVDDN